VALGVDNPLWLLSFIPVVLVLVLFWKNQNNLPFTRKALIVTLRAAMFTLLILALAGLQMLWPVKDLATVFVVDNSDSMMGQEQQVTSFIKKALHEKDQNDAAGIVTVGADAGIEKPLSNKASSVSFQTVVESGYTNLASGLQLAGSMFTKDHRGRIVLMSDGNENIGDVKQQAEYLYQQGYVVDVVPYSPIKSEDVALKAIVVPQTTYYGEEAAITVQIDSNIETETSLVIYEDTKAILKENVQLNKGTNSFTFSHVVNEPGFHTYRAEIVASDDTIIENNKNYAFSEARGLPKILVVEGSVGEARNVTNVLNGSMVDLEIIPPELLPTELSAYINYQTILFSNVSATKIGLQQMEFIETAVKDFGVGFMMTGGKESFGLGGYFKTPIEKLLPVEMEVKGKNELPSLGLVVVLDRSGSMSGYKIELAREAAARSVELLREKDTLGVIAFDDQPWQIVETEPIADKKEIEKKIRSITPGGGTAIFPALEQGYEQLKELKLKRKHIILLTDGQSPTPPGYQALIESSMEENITISTLAVGEGADVTLLEEIANIGGGRFYNVQDVSSIPTIFSRETSLMTRTYIEDEPFFPSVVNGYEWNSTFSNGVPKMNAYIATTAKGRAQQVLVSDKKDPVLARWQYGLGKTIAWTTDLAGWAGDWQTWDQWPKLWNEMLSWTFPQYEQQPYDVETKIDGNNITVEVSGSETDATEVRALLLDNNGNEISFPLQIKSPGEYKGTFIANQPGIYYLHLSEMDGENTTGTFKTGIVVPYSQEYDFDEENLALLEQVAKAGGGKVLSDPDEAFNNNLPKQYREQRIFYPLLLIALLLFLLDVAARRFQFNFAFIDSIAKSTKEKQVSRKESQNTKQKQFEQLKTATKKRVPQTSRMETSGSLKQPDKPFLNKETSSRKQKPAQQNTSVDRKEKMNRLLDAKKKDKRL
jgi:Ca-activated chloride channel homolog